MSGFLAKITALTEKRVEEARAARSFEELQKLAHASRTPHDFAAALESGPVPRVIAEIKRRSPSRGPIAPAQDPVAVARSYIENGASAISVLTEPTYFGGSIEALSAVRVALPEARLLIKDFIIDEYQLLQARAYGADAVLLILALLGEGRFREMSAAAQKLGLSVLAEVHDAVEMRQALAANVRLIGVNNRNLHTLKVSLETSRKLAALKKEGVILISESGLESREQVDELRARGFDAFLIGSSFMQTSAPGAALGRLLARSEHAS